MRICCSSTEQENGPSLLKIILCDLKVPYESSQTQLNQSGANEVVTSFSEDI